MEDGQTLETHLVSYMKQSGVCPPQLDIPPFPYEAEHIWEWWLQLQQTRAVGMAANHITYTEVENWAKRLKINPTPFEVRCIMAIDSAYLSVQNEQQKRKAATTKKQ